MSAALKQAAQLTQALRKHASTLRTNSMPLSDLIPLLNKAADALAALEAAPQQEPVAWAVWWGDGVARKHSVHFEKATADEVAAGIKSFQKEVRPLYAAPQQAQQGVDSYALDLLIAAGHVSEGEVEKARKISARYQPLQQAQAPKVTVCDLVQVDGFGKSSRSQHDADSAELRSLCKARDDARRERDMLRAELAGHEASGGHLSAMVDELRALLSEAMAMMKALHESASPDDGPEMNAIVPAGAFREFVDANAALMHKIHISPHGDGAAAPQQGAKP